MIVKVVIGMVLFVCAILTVSYFIPGFNIEDDYCSVCEWNYIHGELLDYNDPGCGHYGPLMDIWHQCNYGEKKDLDWYESYRLKYDMTSVPSFYNISYDNPRPHSPGYKWMACGMISVVNTNRDPGYPYLVELYPVINNVSYYWKITEIDEDKDIQSNLPDYINFSHEYHVFKHKSRAWHRSYKDAHIIDYTLVPENVVAINQSWVDYYVEYESYLDGGGLDLGDDYWM